jgi:hypothetical protein
MDDFVISNVKLGGLCDWCKDHNCSISTDDNPDGINQRDLDGSNQADLGNSNQVETSGETVDDGEFPDLGSGEVDDREEDGMLDNIFYT